MTTALYLRVSTDIQDHASQRHALETWLSAHPDVTEPLWMTETISGAAKVRPEFERLMAKVDSGEVKHVVVFALDRLGRTMSERLVTMTRFADADCVLESITEGLSDNSDEGMFFGAMRAYVAAVERRKIRQRTSAGIKARLASGRPWAGGIVDTPEMQAERGRPSKRGMRRLTDAQELALVEQVQMGASVKKVAELNGMSRSTLGGILRRRLVDNPK